ncbi:MAG: ABC-F family ATP-binding cassette domain-containing protein [Anaerolineae bacterium]
MSLIIASDLGKYYGAQDVFRSVTFALARGGKVGLVGPNGIGKTTLLRIVAGLEQATEGSLSRASGLNVGYLPQDVRLEGDETLWEVTLASLVPLRLLEAEVRQLEKAIGESDDPTLWRRYEQCQQRFEAMGGYEYEWRARQAIEGLSLSDLAHVPVSQLSGGQQTRAHLARLLLQQCDVLLLDEPTNHLDLQALTWLESFLQAWDGSLIAISHDRYFLDAVANEIWELSARSLERYRGNYSAYEAQKAQRLERLQREYEAQQEHIHATEAFIRRYKAGQRSREAFGRLKRLQRLERIELPPEMRPLRLRLKPSQRSGWVVLEAHEAVIGYSGAVPLFTTGDLQLLRGERAALIGPNGSGKTTFLRTALGEIKPLSGEVTLGHSVRVGYLSQAQAELHPDKTLVEELLSVRELTMAEARDHLALFLFTDDDPFKRVSVLSGGERSRLALAKLMLVGANFLVLDEPTNQLDIVSRDVLETVLSDYDGTILFVSHDRYLIDAIATQVWAIEAGYLKAYVGNYSDYIAAGAAEAARLAEKQEVSALKRNVSPRSTPEARAAQREEKRRQERRQQLEAEIHDLESRLTEVEMALAAASERGDVAALATLGREHQSLQAAIEAAYQCWSEVA